MRTSSSQLDRAEVQKKHTMKKSSSAKTSLVAFGGGSTCSLESFAVECFKQVSGEQVGEQKEEMTRQPTWVSQAQSFFHYAGKSQRANQSTFALLVAKKKISHITCSPPHRLQKREKQNQMRICKQRSVIIK
jgi:hypothetical protein